MSATPRSDFLKKICDMYYNMLSRQSSADLLRQVIPLLKLLEENYTVAFLDGATNLCNDLCRKLLECCISPTSLVQADACNLLYLLMRMNHEHTGKKNFSRVHQQMIISLSQLLGDGMNLNNPTFNRALSILKGFASSDKHQLRFANEIKEVVRLQRTDLMATSQLKEHSDDPDTLADSYAQSPRLRETWMQNLPRLHIKRQHFAEAAQCFLHMAAVTAEVLKSSGVLSSGADQVLLISNNMVSDETLEANSTNGDCQFQCAELMPKADRFEAMGPRYRCVTPILEQMRDYEALITERLSQEYGVKFGGSDRVRLISDSNPVNTASLDPKLAYIQATHLEPYHFEHQTDLDDPTNRFNVSSSLGDYERHTNLRKFFYHCPLTSDGFDGVSIWRICFIWLIISVKIVEGRPFSEISGKTLFSWAVVIISVSVIAGVLLIAALCGCGSGDKGKKDKKKKVQTIIKDDDHQGSGDKGKKDKKKEVQTIIKDDDSTTQSVSESTMSSSIISNGTFQSNPLSIRSTKSESSLKTTRSGLSAPPSFSQVSSPIFTAKIKAITVKVQDMEQALFRPPPSTKSQVIPGASKKQTVRILLKKKARSRSVPKKEQTGRNAPKKNFLKQGRGNAPVNDDAA